MTHGEGAISELKLQHGLGRARRRTSAALQLQALVAATAINLKRLLGRPEAAGNTADGNQRRAARTIATFVARCTHW